MAQRPEQIEKGALASKGGSGSYKRFLKRMTARLRRREAKRDPEEAPKRPLYKGWEM